MAQDASPQKSIRRRVERGAATVQMNMRVDPLIREHLEDIADTENITLREALEKAIEAYHSKKAQKGH